MLRRVFLIVLAAAALVPTAIRAGSDIPNSDRAIEHALNRLAFGPRPGEIERVSHIGLARWIDDQLHPERIPDDAIGPRLARLETIGLDPHAIAEQYVRPAREARRAMQQQQKDLAGATEIMAAPREEVRNARRVFDDLAEAKVLRAVYSERQLEEVLTDFWFNHFNVFARKGQTELYVGQYEREVIRPRVFGSFRDLLGATAKSPAMLFYLDNWISAAPSAMVSGRLGKQAPRGLNENYARELLELHTLGVDGGYTQDDVINVARALTGWTIGRPERPGFRFRPALHDRGAKRVLGVDIQAGGGVDDGERVLDIVARHPSTAKHIAFELAQRFVSDTPPPALVERAAARFRDSGGDLREVVRTIVTSPEFFAAGADHAKVKTPFEFVVSALRATDATVSSAAAVVRVLASMGMPLYFCQPPTGYDETSATWLSPGALVNRMNFAAALAENRVPGLHVPAGRQALARETGAPLFQRQ